MKEPPDAISRRRCNKLFCLRRLAKQFFQPDEQKVKTKTAAKKSDLQPCCGPRTKRGSDQPSQNGWAGRFFFNISVFNMTGEGGSGGGEKVEQIDPLGKMLVKAGNGSHVDQKQGSAPNPEAGQNARDSTRCQS